MSTIRQQATTATSPSKELIIVCVTLLIAHDSRKLPAKAPVPEEKDGERNYGGWVRRVAVSTSRKPSCVGMQAGSLRSCAAAGPRPNRPPTIVVMRVSIRDAHLVIFTETGSLVGNVSVIA
jgi:hypothetical protein